MQLEEPVALLLVPERKERVRPRHPERLAHLVLAAGRGALGLPQHEIGGRVFRVEFRHPRDDGFVPVQDQQDISWPDLQRVFHPTEGGELEGGPAILRVAGVVEVDRSAVLLL